MFCNVIFAFWLLSLGLICILTLVHSAYNLYFHPYSRFPGPFFARISPFYSLWHAYCGDLHIDVLRCHEKYGTFVRYGPNRLIINTTTGLKAVYGQGKNFKKSNGYAPHPYFPTVSNTHNTIDKSVHGRKRRIVSQGFSEATIAASETYILEHVNKLCAGLTSDVSPDSKSWSQARDMAMWTNYFTLDVISDLTFGRAYGLITSPDLRWVIEAIVMGNRHIYMRFACPWLFNVPWADPAQWFFPNMSDQREQFTKISDTFTEERMALIEEGRFERQDIMSALLAARDSKTGEKLSDAETWSEAHLMIAAGGDTTSTALAAVMFYLSRDSARHAKLLAELRTTFSSPAQIRRGRELSSCQYLKACIDEALRLAPAAPGALWRQACEGGAFVDGEYIPEGLDVGTCTYALSHSAQYFEEPFSFVPERFIEKSSANDLDAYAPFSIGPRSCLAKPLAYLELTLALAHIVYRLDFKSASSLGEGGPNMGRGRERKEEFQITDMFSSNKRGPILRFRCRL